MKKKKDNGELKVSQIVERIQLSDKNLSNYTDKNFIRYYKLYRNFIDPNKWSTKARIFIPLVYGVIEAQTSRALSNRPAGEWKPVDTKNVIGDPEKIQLAFNDWWRKERAVMKAQDLFKKTLLYGSGGAQIFWDYKVGYKLGKPFPIKNQPSIRILRLEDKMFGFDPEATSFEECRWAFIRYGMSKKELQDIKSSPIGEKYQNIDEAIEDFIEGNYKDKALMKERLSINDGTSIEDTTSKQVECIYLEDYVTGDRITLVGRKHIIFKQKNPYLIDRQLLMTTNIRIPGEILGMSEVEPIETLQHGVNLFTCQRADLIDSLLNPKTLVGDDADVDDAEIIDEDSLIVHTKDISQVREMRKDNMSGIAFQEDEVLKNDIYAASSVTPFSLGNDNDVKGERSGKAIAHLQSAADSRVKSKLMNFEVDFIKEVAEKWQRLMAQFQTEDIVIQEGDEKILIKPEDLGHGSDGDFGEWNFYVETGSTQHISELENREDFIAYEGKLLELANLKLQDQQGTINYDKMAEKLSTVFNIKDWRDIWEGKEQEIMEGQGMEGQEGQPDASQQPDISQQPNMGQPEEAPQGEPQEEMLPPVEEQPEEQPTITPEAASTEATTEAPAEKPSIWKKLKQFLTRKGKL